MRIITERQIVKSAWHIGKIKYALLHGDDLERLDAVKDLAKLAFIIGGSRSAIWTELIPKVDRKE